MNRELMNGIKYANIISALAALTCLVRAALLNGEKYETDVCGRSQEVLLILKGAMEKKELLEVPVYVDGMVRDTNTAYMRNSTDLRNQLARKIDRGLEPFYSDQIRAVRPMEDREANLYGKKGRISGVGPHDRLMKENKEYAAFYQEQAKWYTNVSE